jgi:hypothetical protein
MTQRFSVVASMHNGSRPRSSSSCRNQRVLDQERAAERRRYGRAARPLSDSNRSAAHRAGVPVRPWKDPQGVIEAFKQARQEVDATLVLLGNFATDDPEGAAIFESLLRSREERIWVLPYGHDSARQYTAESSGGRRAEIDSRGFRPDCDRSNVEGHSGDRRECRRHPLSDRGWDKRIPVVDDRGDGVTDRPASSRTPNCERVWGRACASAFS